MGEGGRVKEMSGCMGDTEREKNGQTGRERDRERCVEFVFPILCFKLMCYFCFFARV